MMCVSAPAEGPSPRVRPQRSAFAATKALGPPPPRLPLTRMALEVRFACTPRSGWLGACWPSGGLGSSATTRSRSLGLAADRRHARGRPRRCPPEPSGFSSSSAFHVKHGNCVVLRAVVIASRPSGSGPNASRTVARETAIPARSSRASRVPLRSYPTGLVIEPMTRAGTAATIQCPLALSARTMRAPVWCRVDCGASRHRGPHARNAPQWRTRWTTYCPCCGSFGSKPDACADTR